MRWTQEMIIYIQSLYDDYTYEEIAEKFNRKFKSDKTPNAIRKAHERHLLPTLDFTKEEKKGPRILIFDIETLPLEVYTWSIWQDSIPINMIKEDWSVLSYSAKWYGEDEILFESVEGQKNIRDDKRIVEGIYKLLDEADCVVGQNSDSFDIKKLNSRFLFHNMKPPSSFRKYDTKKMAKRFFSHTSNKLQFLSDVHCTKHKKLKHAKFPGFSLWLECMKGNPEAFKELKEYNDADILATEELFTKLLPWDTSINFNTYTDDDESVCTCGSTSFKKSGFYHTNASKFQKYKCTKCGAEYRDKTNLLSTHKRKNMKVGTRR